MFESKLSPIEQRVDDLAEEMRTNFGALQEQMAAIQTLLAAK